MQNPHQPITIKILVILIIYTLINTCNKLEVGNIVSINISRFYCASRIE
jgi:hypothetical protein